MVAGINTEAQQNTAGFIYFGKHGALSVYYIGMSSHMHGAKDSDQNRLPWSPMLLVSIASNGLLRIYKAHGLDLQAQQAHTCLSINVGECCQSPPKLLCLLSLILARHLSF